jgi:DNA mismatch repair ATPase MutL
MLLIKLLLAKWCKTRFSCKELLENAVDANASDIKLIIKEAGKSLVQVIDNGRGMSVTVLDCVLSATQLPKLAS